jgi:TM2 domain-containing membrane protein YozV
MDQNILKLKKELSGHELAIYNSEMEKYKKSTGLAYLLWFLLGTLGIHKLYIGKIGMGVLYLVLGIAAWISLIIGLSAGAASITSESELAKTVAEKAETGMAIGIILFIIFIAIVGIMLIIDLFTIPRQIRKAYEKKELKILQKIKSVI